MAFIQIYVQFTKNNTFQMRNTQVSGTEIIFCASLNLAMTKAYLINIYSHDGVWLQKLIKNEQSYVTGYF